MNGLSVRDVAVARQVAGLVLQYPDDVLLGDVPMLRAAVAGLPAPLRGPLGGLIDHVARTPDDVLTAEYVATFDLTRRHALHLTYFTHGDTRKRGLALLRIKQTYRRFGFVLDDTELPDHLSVVLEFAATVDAGAGRLREVAGAGAAACPGTAAASGAAGVSTPGPVASSGGGGWVIDGEPSGADAD